MIDLKFFYVVELNLQHPSIAKLPISREFDGQSWLTLVSKTYDNDSTCVEDLKHLLKTKAKEFNQKSKQVTVSYAENPVLHCEPDEIENLETDFDENALVAMSIDDMTGKWLIKAAVMVYGCDDHVPYRSLH